MIKIPESFRGCASVRRAGRPVFQCSQGMRDRANGIPNAMDTRFPTASAGKAFVATAILQMVETGALNMEDTLDRLVDFDLHDIDPKITLRQLLTHTSGIPDYFDESVMEGYGELWRDFPNYRVRSSADLLPLFVHKPMMHPAGAKFQYNNTGYVVLGLALEKVAGMPFDQHLQRAVFDPAGMTRTGYYELDRLPEGCANAYIWSEERQDYYTNIFSVDAKGTGAGGAFTTLGDVERFWDALTGGRLLGWEMLAEMTRPQARDQDSEYGYGLWIKDGRIPYFTGSDPGVSFISAWDPDRDVTVSLVSNYADDVWGLLDELLAEA